MAIRVASQARDAGRHWLPSQGVDPAPLAELNAECLGLLAVRAAETGCAALPPLLAALRDQWSELPTHAVRRLSAAPFSLFDAGFGCAPRWLELRGAGVHDAALRDGAAFFDTAAARSISRRMLVYGWHLARSRPRAACLVFGATIAAVESLAACSLAALEAAAERNAAALCPRWSNQIGFWRALLSTASAGADGRLHELLLGGIQRLAADTLAAHAPSP
ncbi:MAG TPA: hypothetical protein VFP37_15660 [Steroidobacteraceae bacterium]|nr:hypothetical protein [Steroidobacteraceae bacterium]